MAEAGADRVFEVTAGEDASARRAGPSRRRRASRRTGSWWRCSEERPVGRVVFELSDAPWIAHPAVEVSHDGLTWVPVDARASLADATLSLYRDPLRARGEVRFAPRAVRFLRLDPHLPARPDAFEVAP